MQHARYTAQAEAPAAGDKPAEGAKDAKAPPKIEVIPPTPNVLAALEAFKKLSFVEFVSFGRTLFIYHKFKE